MNLFTVAEEILLTGSVTDKLNLTKISARRFNQGEFTLESAGAPSVTEPGRPQKPELVHSSKVSQRGLGSKTGRAALVHSLAHIEYSAVNLAWDAVYRFRNMGADYYSDWVNVAAEEAGHFHLLDQQLNKMGYVYGDFPAHNGLWDMAKLTCHDILARMAVVHRGLEARGLDVTPGLIERLKNHDGGELISILNEIYRDEIKHVAIGTKWFNKVCDKRGLDRISTFGNLILLIQPALLKKPINEKARLEAGFSVAELELIKNGV